MSDSFEKYKSFETIDELRDELSNFQYQVKYLWWYFELPEHLWKDDALCKKNELIDKAIIKLENKNKIVKSSLRRGFTMYVYLLHT